MAAALLGIDLGTTVLKLGLFDRRTGRRLGEISKGLPVAHRAGAGREVRLDRTMRVFRSAVKELRAAVGERWDDISGIGLGAQGGSNIIVRRESGAALTPMYLWNDYRCHAFIRRLAQMKKPAYWSEFVAYNVPATGLGRMWWLKEQQPELFADDNLHVGVGEYLFFHLTGVWRQDPGNAIQIGSFHAWKRKLDGRALRLIDVPLSFVAPLRKAHETARLNKSGAQLLGLPEGIDVAGPYLDQEAGYLSIMSTSRSPLQCSLGTAWVANFSLPDSNPWSSPMQMMLPPLRDAGRFIVMALPSGNVSWDWALRTFVDKDPQSAWKKAGRIFASHLLPGDSLTCLPWFSQANPLDPTHNGGGVFLGLSPETSPADCVRAVGAGLVYELFRFTEDLARDGTIDSVVVGGGAGKGAYFRTLLAAAFHPAKVYRQLEDDMAAARGALHVFESKASRAAVAPVPKASAADIKATQAGYRRYAAQFTHLYGADPFKEGYRL